VNQHPNFHNNYDFLISAKPRKMSDKPMKEQRLLLCTDMDRTVIPNGLQAEHPDAHKRFAAFCRLPEVVLVYVSGRHLALVQQAIKDYRLPKPDFILSDVGSKIYHFSDQQWQEISAWEQKIDKDWRGKSHQQIMQLFDDIVELQCQEVDKQNTHKLSYYLPLHVDHDNIIKRMQDRLKKENIDASLIWSVAEPKSIGLLDVLPKNATKLHAIDFLRQQQGYSLNEVIFAGDSGNDLTVLSSEIPSVLVANADYDIRLAAQQLAEQQGHLQALYLAGSSVLGMDGNYSAGVLEGIWHFLPGFRDYLRL